MGAEVRYAIGEGYDARRVLKDALPHFKRALEIDPQHTPSLVRMSAVSTRTGNPTQGLQIAQRALAEEPQNPDALYWAGRAAAALRQVAQARTFLERAVALQPQNIEFQRALTQLRP